MNIGISFQRVFLSLPKSPAAVTGFLNPSSGCSRTAKKRSFLARSRNASAARPVPGSIFHELSDLCFALFGAYREPCERAGDEG